MQIKFTKENIVDEYIVLLLNDQLDLPTKSEDICEASEINLKKHIETQKFLGKKNIKDGFLVLNIPIEKARCG